MSSPNTSSCYFLLLFLLQRKNVSNLFQHKSLNSSGSCCEKLCSKAHKKSWFCKEKLQLEESETSPGVTQARQALQCDCLCSWIWFPVQAAVHGLDHTCASACGGTGLNHWLHHPFRVHPSQRNSLLHPSAVTTPCFPLLFLLASLHLIPP